MSKTLQTVLNIKRDDEGLFSLTDIFKQAQAKGMADGKQSPSEWSRFEGKAIIFHASQNHNTSDCRISDNTCKSRIIKSTRGKGGGTLAIPEIALAYAKYLSPELHMLVNQTFLRAQTGDVTLAAEIADRSTPEGKAWLATRTLATLTRNDFTSALCEHKVTGKGYADATNAIYSTLLGGSRKELCAIKGYPLTTNLRNTMSTEELCRTQLAEIISIKNINAMNATGNKECTTVCQMSARKVAAVQ